MILAGVGRKFSLMHPSHLAWSSKFVIFFSSGLFLNVLGCCRHPWFLSILLVKYSFLLSIDVSFSDVNYNV